MNSKTNTNTNTSKEIKTVSFVEEKLLELYNLKERDSLQSKSLVWEQKANAKLTRNLKDGEYATQVSMVIKLQKDAELLASLPEFNFIPQNSEAVSNRRIIKEAFDYWWYKSNTDKQIAKCVSSSTTNGSGILFEGIKHIQKVIKTPNIVERTIDGVKTQTIEFKEEPLTVYSGIYTECIPFRNFFINGIDIDNSTEAVVVRYFDRDDYISEKDGDPSFDKIEDLKTIPTEWKWNSKTTGGEDIGSKKEDNTICELEYWNSATDRYIVIANGLEIKDSPIPYKHKELPFTIFIDNKAENRIFGIGEFELTEEDEKAKDKYRNLTIKAVQANIGFILKSRGSDLDIDDLEFGIQNVYETDDIDEITHFSPNVNIGAISELESKLDNDLISKTGVDFKALLLSPQESATRTASKSNSARKRVNRNIKDNAYDFYRRFAKLRLSNIQFLHTSGVIEIPIEGGSVNKKGEFVKDDTASYGLFKIPTKFAEGDFLVLPIVESMTGDTQQRKIENCDNFSQLYGGIPGPDGKPVVKGKQLIKIASELRGLDFEKLTEESEESKSPKEIVDKIFSPEGGQTQNPDGQDANFVPPEQRSQKSAVQTISGQAKIDLEEPIS